MAKKETKFLPEIWFIRLGSSYFDGVHTTGYSLDYLYFRGKNKKEVLTISGRLKSDKKLIEDLEGVISNPKKDKKRFRSRKIIEAFYVLLKKAKEINKKLEEAGRLSARYKHEFDQTEDELNNGIGKELHRLVFEKTTRKPKTIRK